HPGRTPFRRVEHLGDLLLEGGRAELGRAVHGDLACAPRLRFLAKYYGLNAVFLYDKYCGREAQLSPARVTLARISITAPTSSSIVLASTSLPYCSRKIAVPCWQQIPSKSQVPIMTWRRANNPAIKSPPRALVEELSLPRWISRRPAASITAAWATSSPMLCSSVGVGSSVDGAGAWGVTIGLRSTA